MNKKCLRCKNSFNKKEMYHHKRWDKYYQTYWCKDCLQKHFNKI